MSGIPAIKLNGLEIHNKRAEISQLFRNLSENIKSETITIISSADLDLLFHLYDEEFFDGWFKKNYKGMLKCSLSKRMTKSAGMTIFRNKVSLIRQDLPALEIRISADILFKYNQSDSEKTVCGIKTGSSMEALQIIFEHELCHVIEFILFGKSNCSKDRFRKMAYDFFGHTASSHMLPTGLQIAKEKHDLCIGDMVSFEYNGRRLTGIIHNINKRATVMVRDSGGMYQDNNGFRYSKYYVPLSYLDRKSD